MLNRFLTLGAIILIATAGIVSCSSNALGPGQGYLGIQLTDAPLDMSNVDEVRVTLDEFLVYPADGSSAVALDLTSEGPLTLNLLDYQNGAVILTAEGAVPEGDFNRVRMSVSEAILVLDDDFDPETPSIEEPIFLPSGKVDIPVAFSISAGEEATLTLDFDAERSVQVNETGSEKYILRPVVVPVNMSNS